MTYTDATRLAAVVFWTGIAILGASLLAWVTDAAARHRQRTENG